MFARSEVPGGAPGTAPEAGGLPESNRIRSDSAARMGVQMMTPLDVQRFTSLAPLELLFAVPAVSLAVWPAFFQRKRDTGSTPFEALLQRVHGLRQRRFPVRNARFKSVKVRAKLLAKASEKVHKEPFFRKREKNRDLF